MAKGSFETLLLELSTALAALGATAVEAQLAVWIGRIAEALPMDRIAIWQFVKDTRQVRFTHTYTRGSGSQYNPVTWEAAQLPWFAEKLAGGQRLLLTKLPDDLPASATAEREVCLHLQLKSTLGIPLSIGGTLLGTLAFSSFDPTHEWPAALIQQLELLGHFFAGALHRQQVEAALQASEERLRIALDAATMGTWEWDIVTNQIQWSKNVAAMFGLRSGEFEATHDAYMALIHPEDRQSLEQTVRDCMQSESTSFASERRTLWPDGSVHWVEIRGKVLRDAEGVPCLTLGTIVDITDRKQTENALRESEDQFRTMFTEAPIGLVYVDNEQRIGRVNRAMCEFLGYSAEELTQLTIADISHPDEITASVKITDLLRSGKARRQQREKRYLKKGGEVVWGLLTAAPIYDKYGQVVSALGMVENISARKQIEDEFRQAQKMDAFGQLAGGVAHDFNNLLTAINGYSEISIEQLPPGHFLRANLEEIIHAGERAATLTRQLLAFSRKQVLRPKVIDLSSVIEDMNKLLRRLIGEDIKLVTTVPPNLGKVLADPGQIEQIVVNLAVNARDAMPTGGKLMIELLNVMVDDEYPSPHPQLPAGPYVGITVSDTGCGMTPAVQERVFEPFFSTKEAGRGTGLGLSTVYGIVSQSGGHIFVASNPGQGSKFEIYLPRVDLRLPQLAARSDSGIDWRDTPGGTETILLVEDDDSVRNMVLLILRDRGYDVITACDGQAALLLDESESRKIELLLTDVVMPRMSGRALTSALKLRQPALKVIYMSGYAGDAILHHGVVSDGVVLIEKPFTMDELLRRVREVLDGEPSTAAQQTRRP